MDNSFDIVHRVIASLVAIIQTSINSDASTKHVALEHLCFKLTEGLSNECTALLLYVYVFREK